MKVDLTIWERELIQNLLEVDFDTWDSANFESETESEKSKAKYRKLYDKM